MSDDIWDPEACNKKNVLHMDKEPDRLREEEMIKR